MSYFTVQTVLPMKVFPFSRIGEAFSKALPRESYQRGSTVQ